MCCESHCHQLSSCCTDFQVESTRRNYKNQMQSSIPYGTSYSTHQTQYKNQEVLRSNHSFNNFSMQQANIVWGNSSSQIDNDSVESYHKLHSESFTSQCYSEHLEHKTTSSSNDYGTTSLNSSEIKPSSHSVDVPHSGVSNLPSGSSSALINHSELPDLNKNTLTTPTTICLSSSPSVISISENKSNYASVHLTDTCLSSANIKNLESESLKFQTEDPPHLSITSDDHLKNNPEEISTEESTDNDLTCPNLDSSDLDSEQNKASTSDNKVISPQHLTNSISSPVSKTDLDDNKIFTCISETNTTDCSNASPEKSEQSTSSVTPATENSALLSSPSVVKEEMFVNKLTINNVKNAKNSIHLTNANSDDSDDGLPSGKEMLSKEENFTDVNNIHSNTNGNLAADPEVSNDERFTFKTSSSKHDSIKSIKHDTYESVSSGNSLHVLRRRTYVVNYQDSAGKNPLKLILQHKKTPNPLPHKSKKSKKEKSSNKCNSKNKSLDLDKSIDNFSNLDDSFSEVESKSSLCSDFSKEKIEKPVDKHKQSKTNHNTSPQIILLSPALPNKKENETPPKATDANQVENTSLNKSNTHTPKSKRAANGSRRSPGNSSEKKRGRPSGSRNRPKIQSKGKNKNNAKTKKSKNETPSVHNEPVKLKKKQFNGPYIHLTGAKEKPLSISVINVAPKEEEKDQQKVKLVKYPKQKRDFSAGSTLRKKLSVGHTSTLSPFYDAFTKDKSWICAFCQKGSHHWGLGDLFGPYYVSDQSSISSANILEKISNVGDQKINDVRGQKNTGKNSYEEAAVATRGIRAKRKRSELVEEFFKSSKKTRQEKEHTASAAKRNKFKGKKTFTTSSEQLETSPLLETPQTLQPCASQTNNTSPTPGIQEFWIHEECAVWTHGVCLSGEKVRGLDEAIKEANDQVCSSCKLIGATVGCWNKGCTEQYHVICAREKGCYMSEEDLTMLCSKHKRKKMSK